MTTYVHRALPARPVPTASWQGTLALQFDPPPDRRSQVQASDGPTLRLVPGGRAELEAFAHRFVTVVVEVVGGDRGPSQLLRWTTAAVYEDLVRRAALLQRTTASDRRVRTLRSQVRSVRVFCPSPHAAEVSVHVRQGARSRAIAARLELVQGQWCCTALEFG